MFVFLPRTRHFMKFPRSQRIWTVRIAAAKLAQGAEQALAVSPPSFLTCAIIPRACSEHVSFGILLQIIEIFSATRGPWDSVGFAFHELQHVSENPCRIRVFTQSVPFQIYIIFFDLFLSFFVLFFPFYQTRTCNSISIFIDTFEKLHKIASNFAPFDLFINNHFSKVWLFNFIYLREKRERLPHFVPPVDKSFFRCGDIRYNRNWFIFQKNPRSLYHQCRLAINLSPVNYSYVSLQHDIYNDTSRKVRKSRVIRVHSGNVRLNVAAVK